MASANVFRVLESYFFFSFFYFFLFLRDANPHRTASANFFSVFGVEPLCEGWRPVDYGTPTLTEWPVPFFLFLVLRHSVRVGVPLFTGRQPSHNGHGHFSVWF